MNRRNFPSRILSISAIAVAAMLIMVVAVLGTGPSQKAIAAMSAQSAPNGGLTDAQLDIVSNFAKGTHFSAYTDLGSASAIVVKVHPGLRLSGPIKLALSQNGVSQTVTATSSAEWSLPGTTPKPAVSDPGYGPLDQLLRVKLDGATFAPNSHVTVTVLQ